MRFGLVHSSEHFISGIFFCTTSQHSLIFSPITCPVKNSDKWVLGSETRSLRDASSYTTPPSSHMRQHLETFFKEIHNNEILIILYESSENTLTLYLVHHLVCSLAVTRSKNIVHMNNYVFVWCKIAL